MRLSDHFTLAEAERSQTATRKGIDNRVPVEMIPKVQAVAINILEPPRRHFGIPFVPSSWYRSVELCIAVGSSSNSQHAKGEAVDFEIPTIDNLDLAYWMEANTDFDKLIMEFYDGAPDSGWIHASYRGAHENRHQTFTITKEGTRAGLPSG